MPIRIRLQAGRSTVRRSVNLGTAGATRRMREQFRALDKNIKGIVNQIEGATPKAIEDALRPTFEISQGYVPVDTGKLKASGFLESFSLSSKQPRVVMGYGKGGRPPYTVFVHERTDLRHKPPTRSKFLQAAVEEDIDNIEGRIVKALTLVG